jgi:hypothetical protein
MASEAEMRRLVLHAADQFRDAPDLKDAFENEEPDDA